MRKTMTVKFKGRYRISSNRLSGWDYAGNGHYFLTIVTHDRQPYFGYVENGEMVLSDVGRIAYDEFFKTFTLRKELRLGNCMLMPNHLHAIVTLDRLRGPNAVTPPQFLRKPQSISSFVAGFKSATIKQVDDWIDANNLAMAKFNRYNPLWQSNYYDHIIRNDREYRIIFDYIQDNPLKWEDDMMYNPKRMA